jgi:Trk K+ transport system NAD-binding subunit
VGIRVADLLVALGERVVAVSRESRPDWLRSTAAGKIEIRSGDARGERSLVEAGIRDARALLVLTDQDLVNIEIALDSRRLRPDLTIVLRLFDQRLGRQLEEGFGIRRASAAAALAAPTFAAAAAGIREARLFRVGSEELVLGEIALDGTSRLVGQDASESGGGIGLRLLEACREDGSPKPKGEKLAAGDRLVLAGDRVAWEALDPSGARDRARARRRPPGRLARSLAALRAAWRETPATFQAALLALNLLIAASFFVFRFGMDLPIVDSLYFLVTTVTTTGYGDITPIRSVAWVKLWDMVLMIAGPASLAVVTTILTDFIVSERFRRVLGRPHLPRDGHTIVVGLGNVGYRTLQELLGRGETVVAVEQDERGEHLAAARTKVPVLVGDGRSRSILEEAGAGRAEAIVALTGDDAVNLGIALTAREINPGIRTVVRLFDPEMAAKIELSGMVDRAISASRVAAPSFVAAALEPGMLAAIWTERRLWSVVRRAAGSWAGRSPGEIERGGTVRILRREQVGDESLLPDEPIVAAVARSAPARD